MDELFFRSLFKQQFAESRTQLRKPEQFVKSMRKDLSKLNPQIVGGIQKLLGKSASFRAIYSHLRNPLTKADLATICYIC